MEINEQAMAAGEKPYDLKNDLIPQLKTIHNSEKTFGSLTLLIITLIIFFSAGIVSIQWQEIMILIGVLFFHEAGHFFAMKALKYNDVKMFFIPLIGAAVSGKNEKETAIKSCVVSLMGPVPGIVVGVVFYFLFGLTKNYYILKTAQMMLILNAFNFLPIMPLDGGRYIDVLFIDRRYFRLFFALLGASFFIFLGVVAKDIIIGLIGIFLIIGAFAGFRLYGVSNELKEDEFEAKSINDLIDDEDLLNVVVRKIYEKYPKLFKPKMMYKGIYNQLKTIVDTLKFIPAKVLSKIMLLFLYVMLVIASMGVTFFFIAMDYKEVAVIEEVDGEKHFYAELYIFGEKRSRYPLNNAKFYHGEGVAYWPGTETVSDTFVYENGYRTGEWLTFDEAGDPVEKKNYDQGRLISASKIVDGKWIATPFNELPVFRRLAEEIRQRSQPFKSNYPYFEE